MNPIGEVVSIAGPSGEVVPIAKAGVTFIVGGNNAGKSTVLQEVAGALRHSPQYGDRAWRIISAVETRTLDEVEIENLLAPRISTDGLGQKYIVVNGTPMHLGVGGGSVTLGPSYVDYALAESRSQAITMLDGASRLTLAQPVQNVDVLESVSSPHPLLRLMHNERARDEFNQAMARAFERKTTVDGPARTTVQLRMDSVCDEEPSATSADYVDYIRKVELLEPLAQQGDGMKAFAGLILTVLSYGHPFIFIDEPEAFLHPPQARELGSMLQALSLRNHSQVFVATHSRDIILGAMDSTVLPSIVRVGARPETAGQVSRTLTALPGEELSSLWADPVVKFSNVLDGIFYGTTVVCEDYSDGKWFQAALSTIRETNASFGRDVLFVGAGGKHKLPVLVGALARLGVDVRVAGDFDVLKTERPLRELVTLLGGDWNDLADLHRSVNAGMSSAAADWSSIGSNINDLLSTFDGVYGDEVIAEVLKAMAAGAADSAKLHGLSALRGKAHTDATRLLGKLDALGIVLISTGETESFFRSAGGHGTAWVDAALSGGGHRDNKELRAYLRRLLPQS